MWVWIDYLPIFARFDVVLKPFDFNSLPVSQRHLSQNLSSKFDSPSGFRPRREAPRISFSARIITSEEELEAVTEDAILLIKQCNALDLLTSFPCNSPNPLHVIRHYESMYELATAEEKFAKTKKN